MFSGWKRNQPLTILRDRNSQDFLSTLNHLAENYNKKDEYKVLFCLILTHGTEGGKLFCSDDKAVNTENVIKAFKKVHGKPKVRDLVK